MTVTAVWLGQGKFAWFGMLVYIIGWAVRDIVEFERRRGSAISLCGLVGGRTLRVALHISFLFGCVGRSGRGGGDGFASHSWGCWEFLEGYLNIRGGSGWFGEGGFVEEHCLTPEIQSMNGFEGGSRCITSDEADAVHEAGEEMFDCQAFVFAGADGSLSVGILIIHFDGGQFWDLVKSCDFVSFPSVSPAGLVLLLYS